MSFTKIKGQLKSIRGQKKRRVPNSRKSLLFWCADCDGRVICSIQVLAPLESRRKGEKEKVGW